MRKHHKHDGYGYGYGRKRCNPHSSIANNDKIGKAQPYFAKLQKGYAQTAYYKLAVNECSYLRDYLG
jgi:hypothetical protein